MINKKPLIQLYLVCIFAFVLTSCASKKTHVTPKVESPLGLYKSNTIEKFWLAILQNGQYLLCSPKTCENGRYEKVPANYGVILLDFYSLSFGLKIERLSHGEAISDEYYSAMKLLRKKSFRGNDQALNIGDCEGIPCVGLGHRRNGVKFFKIENFDTYWKSVLPRNK